MEQWEKNLRNKLEKELSEGIYNIGIEQDLLTGKQGYIDFLVEIEKAIKKATE